jgi:phosphoglycolate phosphatase
MMKLVIFDLDGTLADTILDLSGSVQVSLKKRGLPCHSIPEYKLMVGNGFSTLVRRALPPELRDTPLQEEIRAEATAYYAAHPLDATAPYPGIVPLLEELDSRGIRKAVVSNKPHKLAIAVVEGLFPGALVIDIRGEKPEFPRKPDPACVLDLAAKAEVKPEEALYVGDSNVDVATAHNAHMKVAGAAWGFRGADELREAGADYIAQKPEEILAILDGFKVQ